MFFPVKKMLINRDWTFICIWLICVNVTHAYTREENRVSNGERKMTIDAQTSMLFNSLYSARCTCCSLFCLYEITVRKFDAIMGHVTWGGMFCYSLFSFYCSRWATVDVPFIYIDFWLLRGGDYLFDLIKRAKSIVFAWTTEQLLSIYSLSLGVHLHADLCPFLTTFSDWGSLSKILLLYA